MIGVCLVTLVEKAGFYTVGSRYDRDREEFSATL